MPKLTETEIIDRLTAASGWDRLGDMLVRSWNFPSTRRALDFVRDVVELSDQSANHPDIILSYRTVRLEVSTHAEGGLTDADFAFVAKLESIAVDR